MYIYTIIYLYYKNINLHKWAVELLKITKLKDHLK